MIDTPTLTRRRSIAIAGTTLAAGLGGLTLGTDEAGAQANVDTDGLDVEQGGEFSPTDGQLHDVHALINGSWSYRTNTDPAEWEAFLLIFGPSGDDSEAVDLTGGETTGREATGDYALSGSITSASAWDPTDFAVPEGGGETTVDVPVAVAFLVRDGAGEVLVEDRERADLPVTVDDDGMPQVAVGGEVEAVAQDDESDPEPEV